MISLVGQKVLQSTEQIGAKSPAFLFCILQGTTFQQSRKESMSQFPRYIFTATFAFQKNDLWRIVGLAKIAQRCLC